MSQRIRVSLSLSPEEHEALSKWAEEDGRTLSNLVWFLSTSALKNRQGKPSSSLSKGESTKEPE